MMRYLVFAFILCCSQATAATYYVDVATGSNADDGLSEANAWADPGYAAQQMGDGDICYVKSGTYTVTTVTPGAAGPVKFAQASLRATMEGYDTTPGDRCIGGSKPAITADAALNPGATVYLVEAVGAINEPHLFISLRVDAASEPNTTCFRGANRDNVSFVNCEAVNAAVDGFNKITAIGCYAASCGTYGFNDTNAFYCYAESNTSSGYNGGITIINSIARANGSGGFGGGFGTSYTNCVAYGNTGAGFAGTRNNFFSNCVSVNNTTYGFSTADHSMLDTCATGGNTTARINATPHLDYNAILLSGDPFVDAANDDFTPDATANEGALLRAEGINPYGHSGFADVGAVQHEGAASGGLALPPIRLPQQ